MLYINQAKVGKRGSKFTHSTTALAGSLKGSDSPKVLEGMSTKIALVSLHDAQELCNVQLRTETLSKSRYFPS